MSTFYNDNEPFVCAWMQNLMDAGLISKGVIDNRPIQEIKPDEVKDYTRCHWFAGIAGWDYALQLAGWPDDRPVWSASLPCQPFSVAGRQKAERDDRHLWPVFYDLVRECRPVTIFGEQVEAAVRLGWIDRVRTDLDREGYSFGFVVLGAHSVGAPHIRQRIFWVAHDKSERCRETRRDCDQPEEWLGIGESNSGIPDSEGGRVFESPRGNGRQGIEGSGGGGDGQSVGIQRQHEGRESGTGDSTLRGLIRDHGRLGNTNRAGCGERRGAEPIQSPNNPSEHLSSWSSGQYIQCADGKARLIEPSICPLAHGVPNRVGALRGAGNAIVPQVAAEFIKAFMETEIT